MESSSQRGIFPLLLLPFELREEIYSWYSPTESINLLSAFADKLCRINHQIRAEILKHFFSRKTLIVDARRLPRLYDTVPPLARSSLTSIYLHNFPLFNLPPNFMAFAESDWRDHQWSTTPLKQAFPSLKHLRVGLWESLDRSARYPPSVEQCMEVERVRWLCENRNLTEFILDGCGHGLHARDYPPWQVFEELERDMRTKMVQEGEP